MVKHWFLILVDSPQTKRYGNTLSHYLELEHDTTHPRGLYHGLQGFVENIPHHLLTLHSKLFKGNTLVLR